MNAISISLSGFSGLLLLSTLICGLWLRSHGVPAESVQFHVNIAILAVISSIATIIALLVMVLRK